MKILDPKEVTFIVECPRCKKCLCCDYRDIRKIERKIRVALNPGRLGSPTRKETVTDCFVSCPSCGERVDASKVWSSVKDLATPISI